ncbi:MAG: hypothetical protein IM613_20165 [Cytophagales bacterium]|nr:hypothetical protein [Cytophagales bacterium]
METTEREARNFPVTPETLWADKIELRFNTSYWGKEWYVKGNLDKGRFEALTGEHIYDIKYEGENVALVILNGFPLKGTEDQILIAQAHEQSRNRIKQKVDTCLQELSLKANPVKVALEIQQKKRGSVLVDLGVYEHYKSITTAKLETDKGFVVREPDGGGMHLAFFKDEELTKAGVCRGERLPLRHAEAILKGNIHERYGWYFIELERFNNVPVLIAMEDRKYPEPAYFIIDPRDNNIHLVRSKTGTDSVFTSNVSIDEVERHISELLRDIEKNNQTNQTINM